MEKRAPGLYHRVESNTPPVTYKAGEFKLGIDKEKFKKAMEETREKSNYLTPSIEDIRVGYEYYGGEYGEGQVIKWRDTPSYITEFETDFFDEVIALPVPARVPYLTKEQIEK